VGVVLDTSVLVAAERRAIRFEALFESLGEEPVATALAQGHALVTISQREFSRVPGLRLLAVERYLS